MKSYSKGSYSIYHHRYHLVWITKYRYRVLQGELQRRVRTIIAQVTEEMGVKSVKGVVSSDPIHLFVSVPRHPAVSEFVQRAKGRSSRKVQRPKEVPVVQEFPELRKRYWVG